MNVPVLRYLEDDAVGAADGLATDEFLLDQQGGPDAPPPTLRLYSYASHCALVGRFQDLDAEVDVAACTAAGYAVNRRPTGGGTIIMGADQLGVAYAGPPDESRSRAILADLAEGVLAGLAALGVDAELRGKNDLAVDGRKIAGLGVARNEAGAYLFHASVLADLDIALMLRLLKIPVEKMGGDTVAFVAKRMTTVSRELGRPVPVDELRTAVRDGFARTLGARLEPAVLDAGERAAVSALVTQKYATDEWIRERAGGSEPSGVGYAKADGGLVRAQVALAGAAVKAVYLSADFVDAAPGFLPGIEARVRWRAADPDSLAAVVADAWATLPGAPDGVGPEHVTRALTKAVAAAAAAPESAGSYACFVGRLHETSEVPGA